MTRARSVKLARLGVALVALVVCLASCTGHSGHVSTPSTASAPSAPVWAPKCSHFPAVYHAVCVANLRVDSWARAGTFDGHAGCWQLTGAALTVFDCSDGRVIVTSTNSVD